MAEEVQRKFVHAELYVNAEFMTLNQTSMTVLPT